MSAGSLFSGYGGLDLALAEAPMWVSDIDPAASRVLAHRWPGAPNLGDISAVDWGDVPPVDILHGGSPCQDLSIAGKRAGMAEGTTSNLWTVMADAIAALKPTVVIWENVHGALSARAASRMESEPGLLGDHPPTVPPLRTLGRVLGDLATLGFDAEWTSLRASDIGAPHQRSRLFLVAAHPARDLWRLLTRERGPALPHTHDATPHGQRPRPQSGAGSPAAPLGTLPTPNAYMARCGGAQPPLKRRAGRHTVQLHDAIEQGQWGDYAAAVHRWESLTRPAPPPIENIGRNGSPRLSPAFVEWMMGLPGGWVTGVPGVTRTDALRLLGNGIVPQQCRAAFNILAARLLAH